MNDTSDDITQENIAAKRKLVQAYLALLDIPNQQHPDFATLWKHVIEQEKQI